MITFSFQWAMPKTQLVTNALKIQPVYKEQCDEKRGLRVLNNLFLLLIVTSRLSR